jgi:hypothetical protein
LAIALLTNRDGAALGGRLRCLHCWPQSVMI